jgi:hypothetical protein
VIAPEFVVDPSATVIDIEDVVDDVLMVGGSGKVKYDMLPTNCAPD